MWFRNQGLLRNQVNLGEECARNSVSDGIVGNLEKLKMKQNNQKNSDNLVYGCSYRKNPFRAIQCYLLRKVSENCERSLGNSGIILKVFGQFREIICMFSIFLSFFYTEKKTL